MTLVLQLVLIFDVCVGLFMGSSKLLVQPLMLPRRQTFFVRLFMDRTELTVDSRMLCIQLFMIFIVYRLRGFIRYRASKLDCDVCALKPKCCPVTPMRKIMRSMHEGARAIARAVATTDAYLVSHRQRKKIEMLFAHPKHILKLDRLRLRGPNGAKDEFHLAAAAQNLRKLAKLFPIPVAATA